MTLLPREQRYKLLTNGTGKDTERERERAWTINGNLSANRHTRVRCRLFSETWTKGIFIASSYNSHYVALFQPLSDHVRTDVSQRRKRNEGGKKEGDFLVSIPNAFESVALPRHSQAYLHFHNV